MSTIFKEAIGVVSCAALMWIASAASAPSPLQAATLPPTSPGSVDPTFGIGGAITTNPTNLSDYLFDGAVQSDGKLFAIGGQGDDGVDGAHPLIARFLDNGSADQGFGAAGSAPYSLVDLAAIPISTFIAENGRIYLLGNAAAACAVVRLLPDGTPDVSFANSGRATVYTFSLTGGFPQCAKVAESDDGNLVVAGALRGTTDKWLFVAHIRASDGSLDTSFGNGGIVKVPVPSADPLRVSIARSGAVTALVRNNDVDTRPTLVLVAPDGTLDARFNGTGLVASPQDAQFRDARLLADGRVVAVGTTSNSKLAIWRFRPDGSVDSAFGTQGKVGLDVGVIEGVYVSGPIPTIDVQRDGKYVIGVTTTSTESGHERLAVIRLNENGTSDATFGRGRSPIVVGADALDHDLLYGVQLGPDGKIWLLGEEGVGQSPARMLGDGIIKIARLIGEETRTDVIEFYNAILDHYFVTADPVEAAAIDSGASGPGWSLTGKSWLSGGPDRACRFTGSTATDSLTGARRGPNSHFYSINPAECGAVKQDTGWQFESYDFSAWPATNGSCREGTIPVLRVYNGRFAENDSNHRYTTEQATYNAMVARGWIGEGIALCAVE